MVCRLSLNWRAIDAPNQLQLLIAGHRFHNGKLVIDAPTAPAVEVAA